MPFSKRPVSQDACLLEVVLDNQVLCSINQREIPCERTIDAALKNDGSEFVLRQPGGPACCHPLSTEKGWGHFSVRMRENLACQADCLVSDSREFDPAAFLKGELNGIRFQPFFLEGATVKNSELKGQGLFARGLHFPGSVSPGNLSLSCICDACRRAFRLQSFHAGFSRVGYFYSASGQFTLIVSSGVLGAPTPTLRPLSTEEAGAIATLERSLPPAPDGTSYNYLNALRCPYCNEPYIDFAAHPELRPNEYYGNAFFGKQPIQFDAGG